MGVKVGILLILAAAISKLSYGAKRTVEINVKAPWPVWPSSSIVQASEFISDFSGDSFWQFAEGLCDAGTSQRIDVLLGAGSGADATAELQSLVYDAAASALPSAMHHIMDTSLGLNAYAPAAQFFHSLLDGSSPDPCGPNAKAFALLYPGGQALCSAADIDALRTAGYAATCPAGAEDGEGACVLAAGPADGEQSSWDHVYPGPGAAAGAATVHLVLYGTLGEGTFCAMHAAAKAGAAESSLLRYSVRHAFLSQAQSSVETSLQGYGVFLDIKNMEYNTADTGKEEGKKGEGEEEAAARDPLAGIQEGVDEHGLIFSTLLARRPADKLELGMLREELAKAAQEGHAKAGKMKVWKIKDLGLQTVQAIVTAPDPAARFAQYVHSFPSHATELSSLRLRSGLVDSLQAWQTAGMSQYLPHNALLVNGLRIDLAGSTFNVFDLLASLRRELMQQAKLQSLGLSAERQRGLVHAAAAISGGRAAGGAAGPDSAGEGIIRIDVSKGGKHVVAFLNNLEKDAAYKRWPKALRQLLMPSWSLHSIARNLYTLIFVLDPLSLDGISLLMQMQSMHAQQYPVRFGTVLVCDDPAATAGAVEGAAASARRSDVCRLFFAARKAYGDEAAFAFLGTLAALVSEELQASMMSMARSDGGMEMDVDPASLPFPDISRSRLVSLYADTLAETAQGTPAEHQTAARDALVSEEGVQFATNCSQYLSERGLRANSFSLNGIVKEGAEIQGVMQLLGREQYILAQYARKKLITDKTRSIFSAVLSLGRAYPRYHPMLEAADLSFADALAGSGGLQKLLSSSPFLESSLASCPPGSCGERACNTTAVVVPVSPAGLRSALAATQWLRGPEAACTHRLALGFCTGAKAKASEGSAEVRVAGAAALMQTEMGLSALEAVNALLVAAVDGTDPLSALGRAELGVSAALQAKVGEILGGGAAAVAALDAADRAGRALLDAFGLPPACDDEQPSAQLSYNTRRVSVALEGPSSSLHEADLALLAGLEWQRAGQHLRPLLAGEGGETGASDLLLRLSSFAGEYGQGSKRHDVHGLLDEAGFTSSGDSTAPAATAPFMFRVPASASASTQEGTAEEAAASVQVYCIVDPLSIAGQRAAAVLPLLSHNLQLPVTVVLVPRSELTDFPLQNFYRQVLSPHSAAPKAVFSSLPSQHTLTARPDAPEPWNIQTAAAEEDTDNLRCASEGCAPALVSYTLKNVLLAGQCFQTAGPSGQAQQAAPPKGLQLTVSPYDEARGVAGPAYADTLVMQNLGYFQLQANPGLWHLDVAQKATFSLQPGAAGGARVVAVRTFTDVVHRVFVRRDHDEPALAAPTHKAGSVWDSLSSVGGSLFGGSKAVATQADKAETIHVFSLATGHMYERLLRIMMLSVSKRASLKVKFWLFENFLSPAFKAVAAAMAQEWGFEVGYVTYKWPTWLTQQTEKQRIIWGYKILFLDVLFPLDVKKIIYVDADQVVRADLKELWEHDLQGKPYGYVPFCTSRQETLGFQFWRSGYWADHLRGKPYHISALYVVDLHRFREYSVGDQLRAVYDGLARDPNSLANLDQDLPNYAQHSVPIHSLPQEWLWCETWCADKSKEAAKTIDLCNNPLHKEPKLDMARRIISGRLFNESWVQLDDEIKALQERRGLNTRE